MVLFWLAGISEAFPDRVLEPAAATVIAEALRNFLRDMLFFESDSMYYPPFFEKPRYYLLGDLSLVNACSFLPVKFGTLMGCFENF